MRACVRARLAATASADATRFSFVRALCTSKKDLGSDYQQNLEREIEILRRIKHEHIIALKDLFETKHEMYIVMELVQGGELFDKIVEKGSYSESEAAALVRAVLSAIAYLASCFCFYWFCLLICLFVCFLLFLLKLNWFDFDFDMFWLFF